METGEPIHWKRVHDLPDYAFFTPSAHVTRGVGCVECHGRVDQMEVVRQVEPLSMGWCLDCHRNPEPRLRPVDEVTNMTWVAEDQDTLGAELRAARNIDPPVTACSACHR
jgi:formate-dependent nitrite reductase cytochrome c552 subunit